MKINLKQTKPTDYNGGDFNRYVYISPKKDGVYIQLHIWENGSTLFTSSGAKLGHLKIATNTPYILECEFVVNGDRTIKSRNEANTCIRRFKADNTYSLLEHGKLFVFDIITSDIFEDRLKILKTISSPNLEILEHELVKISDALLNMKKIIEEGGEGLIAKYPTHTQTGKRTKEAVKLKPNLTADLEVFNKINGYIWAEDSLGREARVRVAKDVFDEIVLGDIIEVKYESVDNAYIQAKFLDLRFDRRNI